MREVEAGAAPRAATLGLRRVPLLDGLSEDALQSLARDCAWRNLGAGETLIARNAPDRGVHFVVSGRVRVTMYSPSGRQVTFRDLVAGQFLGEIAALDGRPRSADAVAVEATLVASLTPHAFTRLRQQQPTVGERLLVYLATLVRGLSDRVLEVSTLGVQHRIHVELLRMARLAGVDGNRASIAPAPKHADFASQVSTTREQVTRELSSLARDGVLGKDAAALVVLDVARLERLVAEVASP